MIVLVVVVAVFALVALMVAVRADGARRAKRQLAAAEELIDTLQSDAAEHVALGDTFAQIAADEIRQYRRNNRKELA